MSEEKITCILNTDDDPSHFFDQAVEFTKTVMAKGIVSDSMLDNLRADGVLLPKSLLQKLITQIKAGQYSFIPQEKGQLYNLPEWQALDAKIQKRIMDRLWRPSHLAELSLKEICQNHDLAETLYSNITHLIHEHRIQFKTDGKILFPPHKKTSPKNKNGHLKFLSAMAAVDKSYQNHRRAGLQGLFFVEISGLYNAANLLMAIARDIPMRDLEIFAAEPDQKIRHHFATKCCRWSGCRILIKNIIEQDPTIENFLSDHRRRLDNKILCYKYGRRQTMNPWALHCMLETLSLNQLFSSLIMDDANKQMTSISRMYQQNLTLLIPEKMHQMLGDDLTAKLEPGNLALLIQAIEEEDKFLTATQQYQQNKQEKFLKTILIKLGLSKVETVSANYPQRIPVQKILDGLGHEAMVKLSPSKMQFALNIHDNTFTTALRHGFGYILPHIKIEKIMPLVRIYNTPLWDIVKALRFVNQLDNKILEKLEHLVDQNMLDIDFARFLASTFQNKLEKLRLYHLEEVNKNKEVIMLFKEKFLELKKGVVRIVTTNINIIKQHQEHLHIFFSKSLEQLNVIFQDPYKVNQILATMNDQNSRRKIIYD